MKGHVHCMFYDDNNKLVAKTFEVKTAKELAQKILDCLAFDGEVIAVHF